MGIYPVFFSFFEFFKLLLKIFLDEDDIYKIQ